MRKMKDSGIEWIGEIPEEWSTSKIGRYCILKTGSTPPTSQSQYFDGSINWYTPSDFNENFLLSNAERTLTSLAVEDNLILLFPKCTILLVGIGATVGKIGYINENSYCNQQITALIPQNIYYKYLLYYMSISSNYIKDNALYTTLPIINNAYLKDIPLIVPNSSIEQIRIANYLDKRCAAIDSVIMAKETTNNKLKEYRQSVIFETVTKGFDKNVPMKDSGIGWIGIIPSKWKLSKIGRYCSLKTGSTPPTSYSQYFDGEVNWFTPSDFNGSYILRKPERTLTDLAIENNVISLYPKYSILMVSIGATIGKVGYIDVESYSNQQITAIIPQNIYYKYLLYYLVVSSNYIKDNALYTTLPIINNAYLKDIPLIVPTDLEEQKQIADYLDKKCTKIDSVIAANETTIKKLKEYRQCVIYEAVTGKTEIV